MEKYTVTEESLTAVADAIRGRAGTEDALVFPDGFVSAVEGIPDTLYQSITNTLKSYESDKVVGTLRASAFGNNQKIESVRFPNVTQVGSYCFQNCYALNSVYFPSLTIIDAAGFYGCSSLPIIDGNIKSIGDQAFRSCGKLTTLIMRKTDSVATLGGTNVFYGTPIASGTGYIYVPRALVDNYKSATNWSNHANQIRAIEDYPEITGG